MFKRRLGILLGLLAALAVVIVVRLVELQVARAAEFETIGERMLLRPTRLLPASRGTIHDRAGRPLLRDEPTSDICVHYAVLTYTDRYRYLRALARQLQRRDPRYAGWSRDEIISDLQQKAAHMWRRLAELSGQSVGNFVEEAETVQRRVEAIRRAVAARTGIRQPVLEERMYHPVISGADADLVLAVRKELGDYPWLRVVPSSTRAAHDADAVCHLLGRVAEASAERIAEDPEAHDDLRRLRPGDLCGVSGVEYMAERVLRGTRGRVVEDFDGAVIERREPEAGGDVFLTIDLDLQRRVYALLEQATAEGVSPSGASAVVIDVDTREVLALVSYPGYDYARFREDYVELRRDTKRQPLLFRALRAEYPPGSTCKAISLAGALADGVANANTTIECTGHLLPNRRDIFRCWIYNQYPGATHGMQAPTEAVKHSCNIFFFKMGERLGPQRLCHWFRRFGLGRLQGTGLIEEKYGDVPTEEWLARHRPRQPEPQASDAWNWAIGQGEVTATPLQVASVVASIAAGQWEPVRFACDGRGNWINPATEAVEALDEAALRIVRTGMWKVVNERGGTGRQAQLNVPGYEMCGKTGSAQTTPHPVARRYTVEWADGRRDHVVAPTPADALARFEAPQPEIVGWITVETYPQLLEGEKLPAHAWFMGFTQSTDTPRGGRPRGKCYAIAVLVEFGGSGGRVAAPVAKEIAELLLSGEESR